MILNAGREHIVEILLNNGASIDDKNYDGETPLDIATRKGNN